MEILYYAAWAILIVDTLAIAYLLVFKQDKPQVSAADKTKAKIAALQAEIEKLVNPPPATPPKTGA